MRSGSRVTLRNEAKASKLKYPSMSHSLLTISLSCSWPIASEWLSALNDIAASTTAPPSVSTVVTKTATASRHRLVASTRTKRPRAWMMLPEFAENLLCVDFDLEEMIKH